MQKFEINVFIKILLDFFLWGTVFSQETRVSFTIYKLRGLNMSLI